MVGADNAHLMNDFQRMHVQQDVGSSTRMVSAKAAVSLPVGGQTR